MHELIILFAKYSIVLSVAALLFVFVKLDKKHRINFIILLVASAAMTAILVKLATSLHQDPRPFVRDGVKPYFASSTDNGFPSDHTAFSALIGFVVLFYSRKIGIALLLLSVTIGASRVISGVHHGQDVVGGLVIAGFSVALSMLAMKAMQRYRVKA